MLLLRNKKRSRNCSFFNSFHDGWALQWNYILCLGAFLAIRHVEFNFLAVGQRFESFALDGAEMNEHIGAIFTLDKAESFGFVKPFNSTCCLRHNVYLYSERRHVQAPFHL